MRCADFKGYSLICYFFCWIMFFIAHITVTRGSSLQGDMKILSHILPGVYTNSQQYLNESGKNMTSARRHFLMKSTYRPVDIPFLPGSFNVFAEQFHGDDLIPYRQRLYSFSIDNSQRAIRMKIFSFNDSGTAEQTLHSLSSLSHLNLRDLTTQNGCDMFWRRLSRTMFIAATGIECLGTIKGETVRVSVTITLTSKVIQTQEAWYRVKDGTKVVEIEIPYHLIKIKKYKAKSFKMRSKKSSRELNLQNDLPEVPSNGKVRYRTKKLFLRKKFHVSMSTWAINSFRGLQDALTSGRVVHYVVDLSACSFPPQTKINRKSFGDKITMFENIKLFDGKKRNIIKFSQNRMLQDRNGGDIIVREITVFGNGRVLVKVIIGNENANRYPRAYAGYCRLFDYRVRKGGVRFSTDPLKDIEEIKTFTELKSSLMSGKQVRMSVDLTKCSGSDNTERREVGGEIRAYDFTDSDDGIEFTLSRSEIDLVRREVSQLILIGRFLSNGDVLFTETQNRHENAIPEIQNHYRCAIEVNGLRHNTRNNSVKMFTL